MATAFKREFEVVPSGAALGAEIRGVDLSHLDDGNFRLIEQAWFDHLVLLFRGQNLDDDQHIAFSRHFGPLDKAPNNVMGRPWLPAYPEMVVVSNIMEDGLPVGALGHGEAIWHTDMSYAEAPPSAAILRALEVPDGQGDTWFANQYMAYDTLPEAMKQRIAGLKAVHDSSVTSAGNQRKGAPVVVDPREAPGAHHPLVRTHPRTGRKALYLGRRRNAYIVGLGLEESEALLDELWQHATRPELTWRVRWRVGDVVIWDNRCALHRREAFDGQTRRRMHRTQIGGDAPY
jgi:taurine dioxygenase